MRGQQQLFASARSQASRDSGSTDEWETPAPFYALLHEEFSFTLDPCASADNAKTTYYDKDDDGLAQDWGENIVFVNFPYSQAKAWASKCLNAALSGATVVVLCAARTDTGWWQSLAACADEVRFIKGRLAFKADDGRNQSATFPSSVIILRPELHQDNSMRMTLWEVPAEARR